MKWRPSIKTTTPLSLWVLPLGVLITALHHAGLATLTHTPSPMKFLSQILERPSHERPFCVAGHGLSGRGCTMVPDIKRLPLDKIATFL